MINDYEDLRLTFVLQLTGQRKKDDVSGDALAGMSGFTGLRPPYW